MKVINIIDLGVSNSDIPLLNDLYEITPFSNENTLRNFNFESQVPSSLTSTIAIQSQNPRSVENIEDVEILRFLELGINIHTVKVDRHLPGVDTPEDLENIHKILSYDLRSRY